MQMFAVLVHSIQNLIAGIVEGPAAAAVAPAVAIDEPTYCYCQKPSHGAMVGCNNEECPIEWFHFACVGLTEEPQGDWYCKECREALEQAGKL